MRANKIKFNLDKTEMLLVNGETVWGLQNQAVLLGVALSLKEQVYSLRILQDTGLQLEVPVSSVTHAAIYHLQQIHHLWAYIENHNLSLVIHPVTISRLEHCNVLYVGLPLTMVQNFQLIQKAAAMLLSGAGYRDHITSLQCLWAQFNMLVATFKTLNGLIGEPAWCSG